MSLLMRARDPLANPDRLLRRLYAYVAYRVGDGHDAEDVTSDVFERALRYRSSYDPEKGEPLMWLVGIARRCIEEHGARTTRADFTAELVDSATPTNLEERTSLRLTVADAVAALAPSDRELVALRYGADLTARQIAELRGVETNSVEVALHRALMRLRRTLAPELREDAPTVTAKSASGVARLDRA